MSLWKLGHKESWWIACRSIWNEMAKTDSQPSCCLAC